MQTREQRKLISRIVQREKTWDKQANEGNSGL